jgi:hypothetical protein
MWLLYPRRDPGGMLRVESIVPTERRGFRAAYTWWMHGALCLCAVGIIAGVCWPASRMDPAVAESPWLSVIGWGPAAVVLTFVALRFALEGSRARMVIDDAQAEITDWRGRERTVRWLDVERVRLFGWRGLPRHSWIELRTRTAAGTTYSYVPDLITERDALLAEIIARANLHKTRVGWLEAVYERPS